MEDVHARAVPELDGLTRERVGARDNRLRGNYGGRRCQTNQRIKGPVGSQAIEGVFECCRITQNQRPLTEIV